MRNHYATTIIGTIASLAIILCSSCSTTQSTRSTNQSTPKKTTDVDTTTTMLPAHSPRQLRAAYFGTFTIKGAGGEHFIDSAAAHGANTIRTWAVKDDGSSKDLLDRAHKLNLKVLLGIWMPQPKDAEKHRVEVQWKEDYEKNRQKYLDRMQRLLDVYDNHPAVLGWGLGNEVELSPEYLKTVNAMSKIIHTHNPTRHSYIVTVNAPKDEIEQIKTHAPDLDLIGANSYGNGSMFTVANSLEQHWQRPYFFAEYSYHGPWSARKTESKYPLEFSPKDKVNRLNKTFGVLADRPLCAGSVFFLWGHFNNGTRTWFSGLLPEDPTKLGKKKLPAHLTPFTDTLKTHWTGTPVANHAPVIQSAKLDNQYGTNLRLAPQTKFTTTVAASDADNDPIAYTYWIFKTLGFERKAKIAGPISGTNTANLTAPAKAGTYTLLVYAKDKHGKASSHQVPFRVQ